MKYEAEEEYSMNLKNYFLIVKSSRKKEPLLNEFTNYFSTINIAR